MARRIAYTGTPALSVDEVAAQCRLEPDDVQSELIELVIIPGVTAQCEALTGAAIREAEYEEDWPEHHPSGHYLDVGQAHTIISVVRLAADGSETLLDAPRHLQRGQRESALHFPAGRPPGVLRIRYRAGIDLAAYPSVRTWLLIQAATAHEFREALITGTLLQQLPPTFLDAQLAEVTVPPRF